MRCFSLSLPNTTGFLANVHDLLKTQTHTLSRSHTHTTTHAQQQQQKQKQQLYPADVASLLLPALRSMARLVGDRRLPLPRQGLPVKVLNVLEGCLEVLAR